jgi:hypothetical protein
MAFATAMATATATTNATAMTMTTSTAMAMAMAMATAMATALAMVKKYARRYLYLSFSRAGGVYKRYFWASASSETCAPGGSYFVYSVFLGVTLAFLMHSL